MTEASSRFTFGGTCSPDCFDFFTGSEKAFMKKITASFIVSVLILSLSCCNNSRTVKPIAADSSVLGGPQPSYLYFNGIILARAGDSLPCAEVLVERSGKVVYLGSMPEAEKEAGDACVRIDLQGKTVTPGFVGAKGTPLVYSK